MIARALLRAVCEAPDLPICAADPVSEVSTNLDLPHQFVERATLDLCAMSASITATMAALDSKIVKSRSPARRSRHQRHRLRSPRRSQFGRCYSFDSPLVGPIQHIQLPLGSGCLCCLGTVRSAPVATPDHGGRATCSFSKTRPLLVMRQPSSRMRSSPWCAANCRSVHPDPVCEVSTNLELPHHLLRSLGIPIDGRPDQGRPAPERAICVTSVEPGHASRGGRHGIICRRIGNLPIVALAVGEVRVSAFEELRLGGRQA